MVERALRIVHCFRSPVGGIFRHVRDLCAAQSAEGHAVGIVCDSSTGGAHEDRLFREIAPSLALGVTRVAMQRHVGPGDSMAAWRAFRAIKRMQPDVLHGHGAKGGVYARFVGTMLRAGKRRPVRIYSPHGGSLHYDAQTKTGRLFFGMERLMDRVTDHILFVSDYERQTYIRKVGRPRAASSLVYNGLRAEEFAPVPSTPDAADFLYVGMMRDLKGPDLFIDALALAEQGLERPLRAVMVGDGEDRDRYVEQARALGLSERIRFLPAQPARDVFGLGDVMVVPSRAEAMPYIVLEALAAGRPLIASAVGGIPEVFGQDSPALTSPDSTAIANRMMTALQDRTGFAETMPSQSTLKARFGADVMAAEILKAYCQALRV